MIKPDSLRKAIIASVPALKRDPERLLMFLDRGKVTSRMTENFSFSYSYTLNIIVSDFAGHPSALMIIILSWLRVNQPELLTPGFDAIAFDADIIDNKAIDLSLELALTEQVSAVRRDDGGFDMTFVEEADPLFDDGLGFGDDLTAPPDFSDIEIEEVTPQNG